MKRYLHGIVVATAATGALAPALAVDYLTYVDAIDVGKPLGRLVVDPVRPKLYGITGDGDVVFIDRSTWSVENVVPTGRVLRDVDLHPGGDALTVMDNVTGEYWNQPPAIWLLDFDLETQSQSDILLVQAPLYQMAHGLAGRVVGVEVNQFVDAHIVDAETGADLDSMAFGTYSSTEWEGPNHFIASADGTRVYRTEIASSPNTLLVLDASTDELSLIDERNIGGFTSEPVTLNATETSLYVGETRFDPNDIQVVFAVFPEYIYEGTGNDALAFGSERVYDPRTGAILQDMPVGTDMMLLDGTERFLYAFDRGTGLLHVMSVDTCPVDLDDDGRVGFDDLVLVLTAWGNEGGPEDLDGSGLVDFDDLIVVLDRWGPCP